MLGGCSENVQQFIRERVLFVLLMQVGHCYYKMSKFPEAKIQLEEILREQTVRIRNNDAESCNILTSMAQHCLKQHIFGEAKRVLEVVLNDQVEIYDSKDLSIMASIALSLSQMGKKSKMKLIVEKGLNRLLEVDLQDHPSIIEVAEFTGLGYLLGLECEYYTQTMNLCKKLFSMPNDMFGENHPEYLEVMEVLSVTLMNLGEFAEAKAIHSELLEKTKEINGEGHEELRRIKQTFFLLRFLNLK